MCSTPVNLFDAFRAISDVIAELNRTLLCGWPFDEHPTQPEAEAIDLLAAELGLHEPGLDDRRRWYIAGQMVALIAEALAGVDRSLAAINGRTLIPADEAADWLLDIRQTLDRYYAVRKAPNP